MVLLLSILLATKVAPTSSPSTRATETGSLSCEVKDSSGKPLSAVVVFHAWGDASTIERTGEDGRFIFDNLTPGKYQIAFCALGFFPELKNVRVKPDHLTKVRVRLRVSKDDKASGCEGMRVSAPPRDERDPSSSSLFKNPVPLQL